MALSREQALLAFKQRRQRDPEADSVKEQEGNFAVGMGIGALTGIVATGASVVDMAGAAVSNLHESPGLADKVIGIGSEVASRVGPGATQGFDAGNWLSVGMPDATDAMRLAGGLSIVARKRLGRELTEKESLIVEQLAELRLDAKRVKGLPKRPEGFNAKLKEEAEKLGFKMEEIIPGENVTRNREGFPPKSKGTVGPPGEERAREATQMPAPSSQHEGNPLEHSGSPPREFPNMADVMEEAGKYGAADSERWRRGFDPVKFERHRKATAVAMEKFLTKGTGDTPQFWVYDMELGEVVVVKRQKDGSLLMDKTKGRQPDKYKRDKEGKVEIGDDGLPEWNPKIDLIVPSNAREFLQDYMDRRKGFEWLRGEIAKVPDNIPPVNVPRDNSKWLPEETNRPVAKPDFAMGYEWMDAEKKQGTLWGETWKSEKEILRDLPQQIFDESAK